MPTSFQVDLNGRWHNYVKHADRILKQAFVSGKANVKLCLHGQSYSCDLVKLTQTNLDSRKVRKMRAPRFQVNIDGAWKDYDSDEDMQLRNAVFARRFNLMLRRRGYVYHYDLAKMVQTNTKTGNTRKIRVPFELRSVAVAEGTSLSRKLKVVESRKKESKMTRCANGSSIAVKIGKVRQHLLDARSGRVIAAKKVTKKTKVEVKRGRTIETETITIKRMRTTRE